MDVKSAVPGSLAAQFIHSKGSPHPEPRSVPSQAAQPARTVEKANEPPQVTLSEPVRRSNTRLQLAVDPTTSQVYGRVVDADTGQEVRQIPSEELRGLRARVLEALGPYVSFVDETI